MTTAKASACPCDEHGLPEPVRGPGLETVPRRIGTFAEFRRAMLRAVRSHGALATLRARDAADLGVMLVEMWAYVSDVIAFYDETIAHEAYLRTARLAPSVRRLVGLLGYRPRPAVSAVVPLTVTVDGVGPAAVRRGTQFTSGAFDGEPPQIFEAHPGATAHSRLNRAMLALPRDDRAERLARVFLRAVSRRIGVGTPVLLVHRKRPDWSVARLVARVTRQLGEDGETYLVLHFDVPAEFPPGTSLDELELRVAGRNHALRRPFALASSVALSSQATPPVAFLAQASEAALAPAVLAALPRLDFAFDAGGALANTLLLGEVNREIRAGAWIVCQKGTDARWFRVLRTREVTPPSPAGLAVFVLRNVVTELELDRSLNAPERRGGGALWREEDRDDITVHHGFEGGPELVALPRASITPQDRLALTSLVERGPPPAPRAEAIFEDAHGRGVHVRGHVDFVAQQVTLAAGEGWQPPLRAPVVVRANVVHASRGVTVSGEVLGDGDAAVARQTFKLAKKPLTYLPGSATTNPWPVVSTLQVAVDGILWDEAPSFFDAGPDDRVFVVRQDDQGDAWVHFGDGKRGARLPTGSGNVVASYRFGAGKKSPPAGSITELVKPASRVSAVHNPVPAAGGSDREGPEELRASGPASALTLGRAVSVADMGAVVHSTPGVRATRAEWRWDREALCAVAVVHYVGADAVEALVVRALRAATDPATHVVARRATSVPVHLAVQVTPDPRREREAVAEAVVQALVGPEGALVPERLGIGTVLYRSRVIEILLGVPGVARVGALHWNRQPWNDFARKARAGTYFDFESPGVTVLAREQHHDS